MLWVFGRSDVPVPSDDAQGQIVPTWAGTGFRLEAFLEGATVQVVPPSSDASEQSYSLHRLREDRILRGPEPALAVSEVFTWRRDGFRLAERALTLPAAVAGSARGPETAVLSFYEAVGRGDLQSAVELLG